jgi:hypothetical protein
MTIQEKEMTIQENGVIDYLVLDEASRKSEGDSPFDVVRFFGGLIL